MIKLKLLLESTSDLQDALSNKYGVDISLMSGHDNRIELSKIIIPKENRGEGIGDKVMRDLISYADTNNRVITLTPTKEFGASSINRLTNFYKKYGFVKNSGKHKDYEISDSMYRNPK